MSFYYNIIFQDGRPAKFSRPFVAVSGAGWLSSILSGCRVCSHGCKRAARAASGAVCRLPSCQGAVCLSWMQKSCQGCQWCRVCCLPSCQGAVCLSWMQKSCQRVPTGAYCLQNWQSRHTKLSYIIECVKYHRFIECAKYHRFFS